MNTKNYRSSVLNCVELCVMVYKRFSQEEKIREGLPQSGSLSLKQGLGFAWGKEKIHREIKLLSGNCPEINKPY